MRAHTCVYKVLLNDVPSRPARCFQDGLRIHRNPDWDKVLTGDE